MKVELHASVSVFDSFLLQQHSGVSSVFADYFLISTNTFIKLHVVYVLFSLYIFTTFFFFYQELSSEGEMTHGSFLTAVVVP